MPRHPRRLSGALLACGLVFVGAGAPSAGAADFAESAFNIVPSGQYGAVPPPLEADAQARMYDALTPLRGAVTAQDLSRHFKSAALDPAVDGPLRTEPVPRPGVLIRRDRFNVPHITGVTREDVVWATGWVTQQDRGLLLEQGRYAGRLAALDVPNLDAFSLVVGLRRFAPTRRADAIIGRQSRLLRRTQEGREVLREIDIYLQGVNDRIRAEGSPVARWTRVDVYSVLALAGQIFGEGGGEEVRSAGLLDGLQDRLGAVQGRRMWDDLTLHRDPEHPATLTRRFTRQALPAEPTGNVVIDHGTFRAVRQPLGFAYPAAVEPAHASNFLLVGARRSATGHPLFVAGPQIGYSYPGLTLEMNLKGPGFESRGVTAPALAGNILIGRGPDFAWSLSSAGSDLIDQWVNPICDGSRTRYEYRGRCLRLRTVRAGTILGEDGGDVVLRRTLHGPVVGYARVGGRRVVISETRASHGRDVLWLLPFRDATLNRIRSARGMIRSFARSPYSFNVAYADDRDIAMYSAGRLPVRAPGVDPRLPTDGTGAYGWRGFLPASRHPQGIDPRRGLLVNWNNAPARGWPAADTNFQYGSVHRVQLLQRNLRGRPTHDLASVVGAMNAAATQDLRALAAWPTIAAVLRGEAAPSARAAAMAAVLEDFRAQGAHHLDADGDGRFDHPGAAVMNAIWDPLADAALARIPRALRDDFEGLAGVDANVDDDFTNGRLGHVEKDLRSVLGRRVRGEFNLRYCGRGDLAECRRDLWGAIDAAGARVALAQGDDPAAWRAPARTIVFSGALPLAIRYTNRPSGIQQVLSFRGHR